MTMNGNNCHRKEQARSRVSESKRVKVSRTHGAVKQKIKPKPRLNVPVQHIRLPIVRPSVCGAELRKLASVGITVVATAEPLRTTAKVGKANAQNQASVTASIPNHSATKMGIRKAAPRLAMAMGTTAKLERATVVDVEFNEVPFGGCFRNLVADGSAVL